MNNYIYLPMEKGVRTRYNPRKGIYTQQVRKPTGSIWRHLFSHSSFTWRKVKDPNRITTLNHVLCNRQT